MAQGRAWGMGEDQLQSLLWSGGLSSQQSLYCVYVVKLLYYTKFESSQYWCLMCIHACILLVYKRNMAYLSGCGCGSGWCLISTTTTIMFTHKVHFQLKSGLHLKYWPYYLSLCGVEINKFMNSSGKLFKIIFKLKYSSSFLAQTDPPLQA